VAEGSSTAGKTDVLLVCREKKKREGRGGGERRQQNITLYVFALPTIGLRTQQHNHLRTNTITV
jgi:hypothetical protein